MKTDETTTKTTNATTSSTTRTGGVADYFTILGVGEKLIWKHTQKKGTTTDTSTDAPGEDDAALLERFYREVVDVTILAAITTEAETDSAAHNNHHQQNQQHIVTSVPSFAAASDTYSHFSKKNYSVSLLPSPSDVTSAITATEVGAHPELHGLNVIQNTRPAGCADPDGLWSKFQTFEANLDPTSGLRAELRAMDLALQKAKRRDASTPLKDLRRKMASALKRRETRKDTGHRFYLAYRRRAPDESNRPGVSDIQLLHVRLHKNTLPERSITSGGVNSTVGTSSVVTKESKTSGFTPSLKGAAGLAARVAEAAGNRVRERVRPQQSETSNNNTNSTIMELSDIKLLALEEFLSLPKGFDEWSIPEEYKFIRMPTSARSESPSQSSIRAHNTFLLSQGDDATQASGSSAVGVEAMASAIKQDDSAFKPRLLKEITDITPEEEHTFVFVPVLAVKRQRVTDEERYHEDAAIIELSITFCDRNGDSVLPDDTAEDDDDEEEDDYLLKKSSWVCSNHIQSAKLEMMRPSDIPRRPFGSTSVLVRRNIPLGFADAAFATRVLDRFPERNYKGLPLPEEELPMFCYPTGCRLHRAKFSDAPLAQYYGFVVKNERGDSIYVSCVSFMEPLTKNKIEQLAKMSEQRRRVSIPHRRFWEKRRRRQLKLRVTNGGGDEGEEDTDTFYSEPVADEDMYGDDDYDELNDVLTGFDEMTTFENKTICLVSRYPFWTAYRRFLSHLHILSGSSSDIPLERCISHLLLTVPIPKPGGPSILVPLPALNVPMVMSLPPSKDLPLVDLPFERLMACLDVPTVVTVVLGFLALERKVIVMSTRPSLVLDACELLRSLLFPFDLCAPYVPRLTEPFMSCLDFPGAIFVGIHDDGSPDGLAATVRRNMPEDSTIVDLDPGSLDCNGDRMEILNSSWGLIPPGPRSVLVSEIETLCRDAGIVPGQEPIDSQIDSAFDVALPNVLVEDDASCAAPREPLDDRAIRDAFLRFFCSVLGGYERYLVVPDVDFLVSGNEWFDSKGFLAAASEEKAAFLGSLVSTQLFQSFIQRRTEASDVHCLLFDECLAEFHSSPIPYGRLGGDVESVVTSTHDQPQMLYSLLVDQSATEYQSAIGTDRSFDTDSKHGSDTDSSTYQVSKFQNNSLDASDKGLIKTDPLLKKADVVLNATGDWVTVPSKLELPEGTRFIYCVDGNPCFPDKLNPTLFLPRQPESWLVEMSTAPTPSLCRTDREVEEAERRRRLATTYRGLQTQRRCMWQLPKLMGSHFMGTWLMCVPSQVAQEHISTEQQSKYLLRAFGALRLLRGKQRIVPDEAAYRALMVACGRTRNDRRMELVKLFGLLRSDGIFPSAVTLGQYTKALAEGYSKRTMGAPDEDIGGVEVTESASRDLRVGVVRSGTMDAEVALSSLDGNLTNLEDAGRRWRQKTTEKETAHVGGDDPSAAYDTTIKPSNTDRSKKRQNNKTWLPVVFSSSFVPAKQTSDGSQEARALTADSVGLIAIWSRTKSCESCGYVPLEEEVQAGWDVLGGENDIPGAINCPRCGSLVMPMLGYKEITVQEALKASKENAPSQLPSGENADFDTLPPQIGPFVDEKDASFVAYISPASMQLSLERHISEHGEAVLDREFLRKIDPELFFNFWWYCARFSLPLPLPITLSDTDPPKHYCAFAAWDNVVAERGCQSCARALSSFLGPFDGESDSANGSEDLDEIRPVESFDDYPFLARFNLQGFFATVWDHVDLSEILVTLVEACDKRDFKPVIETLLKCNKRRRDVYGPVITSGSGSDVGISFTVPSSGRVDNGLVTNFELDIYRTILYLAKYQCTTAFHAFFPATLKPCKGYHFWCPVVPLPIFDRLLREAVKRIRSRENSIVPMYDVSDVALGFRCVFGHLI